jgi:hypothetical protein
MSWKRLLTRPIVHPSVAAKVALAATFAVSFLVVSEVRAIVPEVAGAGLSHAQTARHLGHKTSLSDRSKLPSSLWLAHEARNASVCGPVRVELDIAHKPIGFNSEGAISYRQFVVVWRDSVESVVVLPGTPPPSF